MLPIIALIGRPNVGKSTLFNCVTRTRDAIVADFAGLTRDRQYGIGILGGRYIVVDTGGIGEENEPIETLMANQTRMGIEEADVIIWLVEATNGLTAADEFIAQELRKKSKPLLIAVNKTDGIDPDQAASEFFTLGMGQPSAIAAAHGRGVTDLMTRALELLPPELQVDEDDEDDEYLGTRIAFIGKPNVGKSTLVNRILGEDRVVVSEVSGTTRDSIYIPFSRNDEPFTLIDTAGVRRRARVNEAVEKFSIIKTIKAIDSADVVINVIDAREGITDQDMHLMGLALNQGRAMVLAINKWDGMDEEDRERVKNQIDLKLPFLDFVEKYFISALHGSGVGHLFEAVERAYTSATLDLSTSQLTRVLEDAIKRHQPPLVGGRRIKLRYAHQGGRKPPVIVLHGNQTNKVPGSYRRYLENFFRKALRAVGTPLRIEFKTGDNPFEVKKSRISASQQKIIKEAKLKKRH